MFQFTANGKGKVFHFPVVKEEAGSDYYIALLAGYCGRVQKNYH